MSDLESLLRASTLRHGRICLFTQDGEWYGAVTHFAGHQTTMGGDKWHGDPVDALRAALVEDDRRSRELSRRYAAAPKVAPAASGDDEFEGMF